MIKKYERKDGNVVVLFDRDNEAKAYEGIQPLDIEETFYDVNLDIGCIVLDKNRVKLSEVLDFEDVVKPVIEYMAICHHAHTKLIVESNRAEILESMKNVIDDSFIKD